MAIKKKLLILLVGALSICLFFAFGFQIDVSGVISKDGGTADVSLIEPLRVAVDEANAGLEAAQLALEEAEAALAAAELTVAEAQAALAAAQQEADDADAALLAALESGIPKEILAAEQGVLDAQAALAAAQLVLEEAEAALKAAQLLTDEANAALKAAELAVGEANAAFSGLKTKNNEELETLQLAVDEANAELKAALEAEEKVDEEVIADLEQAVFKAEAALEEFEPGENGIMYSHIIINSNNGGSFNEEEGNHSGVDGDELNFTFDSKDGFDLVWLRVGNTKFATTEEAIEYIYSSDKKNLTIHAHFKKDKDCSPGITVEETGLEEDAEQGDENDEEKGNGKGKDKEKSNNGKKNK